MKINCFSVTFWFNIYDDHKIILDDIQNIFKEEYSQFNVFNYTNNLINPILRAINNEKRTNFLMSQINCQYTMDNVTMNDFDEFQEKVLSLFDVLKNNGLEILHTSLFINSEIIEEDAISKLVDKTISKTLCNDDIVDVSLKLGKKYEDLFYKIITLYNKKQMKLPKKTDDKGRLIPIPLISWHGAFVENEIIDVSYEINDKYSYDYTANYQTTEFYLNKMLYLLKTSFEDDINGIITSGTFND